MMISNSKRSNNDYGYNSNIRITNNSFTKTPKVFEYKDQPRASSRHTSVDKLSKTAGEIRQDREMNLTNNSNIFDIESKSVIDYDNDSPYTAQNNNNYLNLMDNRIEKFQLYLNKLKENSHADPSLIDVEEIPKNIRIDQLQFGDKRSRHEENMINDIQKWLDNDEIQEKQKFENIF